MEYVSQTEMSLNLSHERSSPIYFVVGLRDINAEI